MHRFLRTLAIGSLLLLGAGLAQSDASQGTSFGDVDRNADAAIDETEFADAFSPMGLYGAFDADASGALDEEEFAAGVFALFDSNGDGILDEEEVTAIADRQGEMVFAAGDMGVVDLDADGNDEVSPEEFAQGYDASGTFSAFDLDASGDVSESEFNQSVFALLDADDDGTLGQDEFEVGSSLFGSGRDGGATGGVSGDSGGSGGASDADPSDDGGATGGGTSGGTGG